MLTVQVTSGDESEINPFCLNPFQEIILSNTALDHLKYPQERNFREFHYKQSPKCPLHFPERKARLETLEIFINFLHHKINSEKNFGHKSLGFKLIFDENEIKLLMEKICYSSKNIKRWFIENITATFE